MQQHVMSSSSLNCFIWEWECDDDENWNFADALYFMFSCCQKTFWVYVINGFVEDVTLLEATSWPCLNFNYIYSKISFVV